MLLLTPEQQAAVEANSTFPNYLFRVALEETNFWATNKTTNDDAGIEHVAGFVKFGKLSNDEFRFSFWNEDYRHTENCVNGVYLRNGVQVAWKYSASEAPRYWEAGYAEEGYVAGPDDPSFPPEQIEVFNGFIYSMPRIDSWIEVIARPSPPRFYPGLIISRPFANFLPSPGRSLEFDGAIFQIED